MSERAREIPALLFALAWLAGVVVGPALHLARHADLARHDHGRAATAHCHGEVCHEEGASAEGDESAPSPDHGEGSLEHGGLALLAPAPALPALLGAPVAEVLSVEGTPRPCALRRDHRARARAPPSGSTSV